MPYRGMREEMLWFFEEFGVSTRCGKRFAERVVWMFVSVDVPEICTRPSSSSLPHKGPH